MPREKFQLSKKNSKKLQEYITHKKLNINNDKTLSTYESYNRKMLHKIGKDYNKITIKDIEKFYSEFTKDQASSKESHKPKNKDFLRYIGKNNIADQIKIDPKPLNTPTKSEEDCLTPEEINKLIETPLTIEDKALIETCVILGTRQKAIRNITIGDITIENDNIKIHIKPDGKVKERTINIIPDPENPISRHPKYLIKFLENHPYKNETKKPVFYSKRRNNYGNKLGIQTVSQKIKEYAIKGKIRTFTNNKGLEDSKVTSHIIRHTIATYQGRIYSDTILKHNIGWVTNTKMIERYNHTNDKMIADHLKNKIGITKTETKKGKICPRCNESNHINSDYCKRCNQPLSIEAFNKKQKENEQEYQKEINKLQQKIKDMDKDSKDLSDLWNNKINEIREQLNFVTNELNNHFNPTQEDLKNPFPILTNQHWKQIQDTNNYQLNYFDTETKTYIPFGEPIEFNKYGFPKNDESYYSIIQEFKQHFKKLQSKN